MLQLGIACYTCYGYFIQLQMTEEDIGRVFRMMMCRIIVLRCHCHTYT